MTTNEFGTFGIHCSYSIAK